MSYDRFTTTSSGKAVIDKDPDAVLDYTFLFSAWVPSGDTIVSQQCVVDSGTVRVRNSFLQEGLAVVAILEGGTTGETAVVRCRVYTAEGRMDDRTIYVKIKQA